MKVDKNISNIEIAELLKAVAASYKIKDEQKNRFRIIAYERAADAIEHLSSEAKDLWDDNKISDIAGVGKSIEEYLGEIFEKGRSTHFGKVMKGLPPAMYELVKIPGIGAKTAYKLAKELNIKEAKNAVSTLEKHLKSKKPLPIEGFGEQKYQQILKSINVVKKRKKRILLPYAKKISTEIIDWMKKCKSVSKIDVLGSLRRKASTIGDIDLAVSTNSPKEVIEHFIKYPKSKRVIEKGDKTASILLPNAMQIDLMVQKNDSYGALLQHFTGSKHHNIALREYALKKNMSLSEKGIKINEKIKKFKDEESFYNKLGLQWIPPELREDMGEIQEARNNNLPILIKLSDIRSDLQIHSNFDIETSHDLGESSMKDVVKKADSLNYEYIAFTEHNPSHSKHNDKQVIELLQRKSEAIEQINYSIIKNNNTRVRKVFNSLEIDILPNGDLAISEKALNLLDFALISIHSSFNQSKNEMTERIIRGLNHEKVKIFAHPTARKLNVREGIEINWEKIFEFCIKNKKILEINADPMRLDLPDYLVKDAIKKGIKLSIGTDAHHVDSMDNMEYGISVARRGWATKKDIINTYDLRKFEKLINSN